MRRGIRYGGSMGKLYRSEAPRINIEKSNIVKSKRKHGKKAKSASQVSSKWESGAVQATNLKDTSEQGGGGN